MEKAEKQGWVEVWTWTAIALTQSRSSATFSGSVVRKQAHEFMEDDASCLSNRIQLTTDVSASMRKPWKVHLARTSTMPCLVKICAASNDSPESRYSPATCIGSRRPPARTNHLVAVLPEYNVAPLSVVGRDQRSPSTVSNLWRPGRSPGRSAGLRVSKYRERDSGRPHEAADIDSGWTGRCGSDFVW
jgi:hypothetical protein